MTHNKSNKVKLKEELAEVKHNADLQFESILFDHITSKFICTNCNSNPKANPNCCSNPRIECIGKITRTPKGSKRSKWKKFYQHIIRYNSLFLKKHPHIIDKYNIDPNKKWIS